MSDPRTAAELNCAFAAVVEIKKIPAMVPIAVCIHGIGHIGDMGAPVDLIKTLSQRLVFEAGIVHPIALCVFVTATVGWNKYLECRLEVKDASSYGLDML